MRKLILVLACGLAFGSVLTACGKGKDDGIPSANTGTGSSSQAPVSDDPEERMRQFAQCMRDNGIDMSDPEVIAGGGAVQPAIPANPGGEQEGPPSAELQEKLQKANEACQHLMPEGGTQGQADPEAVEKMRNFAKCMRENGIENFPDPQPDGGMAVGPDTGIDPRDPAFQEAAKKCREQAGMPGMPAGGGPGTS